MSDSSLLLRTVRRRSLLAAQCSHAQRRRVPVSGTPAAMSKYRRVKVGGQGGCLAVGRRPDGSCLTSLLRVLWRGQVMLASVVKPLTHTTNALGSRMKWPEAALLLCRNQ